MKIGENMMENSLSIVISRLSAYVMQKNEFEGV